MTSLVRLDAATKWPAELQRDPATAETSFHFFPRNPSLDSQLDSSHNGLLIPFLK